MIWLDKRLSALDKVMLAEIYSLDTGRGCYASNEYIAEFCQCSERKVSEAIAKLIKFQYLEPIEFNGRQRILRASVANFTNFDPNFCEAESQNLRGRVEKSARQSSKNCEAASQNLRQNNIDNNIDINSKKESIKERAAEKTVQPRTDDYDTIIENATQDESLRDLYREYIKMRKLIKSPMTNRALTLLINKCENLSGGNVQMQKQMLNEAITHNWKSVYAPKEQYGYKQQQAPVSARSSDRLPWVPDEVYEQPNFGSIPRDTYPSRGYIEYYTPDGKYAGWEAKTQEQADKIEADYRAWVEECKRRKEANQS